MAEQYDVVVIGEALVDIVHGPHGVHSAPGGSPANVALALGRRGLRSALVTQIARDDHGDDVRAWLEESSVDIVVPTEPTRTSTATAHLDAGGAATYDFDIAWAPEAWEAIPARFVHTGSVAAILAPGADTVESALRDARAASVLSFDPNIRPSLADDPADVRARVERLRRLVDVVKVSGEDLDWLHPGEDHAVLAERWLGEGPALVVVTEGGDGSFAVHASGRVAVDADPVTVVDTVGAGDTFMAALIAGLAGADADSAADVREALAALDAAAIHSLIAHAAAAAAVTVSRPGADPPWQHELLPDASE